MHLEGKSMCVKVKLVDVPLDYNLLLGQIWTYALTMAVSSSFQVLCFPREGMIVTVDQFSFSRPEPSSGASMVPMIDNPQQGIVKLGAGIFPYLMGTFYFPPYSNDVNFISFFPDHPKDVTF
jgi:hypothetical protein